MAVGFISSIIQKNYYSLGVQSKKKCLVLSLNVVFHFHNRNFQVSGTLDLAAGHLFHFRTLAFRIMEK